MRLTTPPSAASWSHQGAQVGCEIVYFVDLSAGYRLTGHTAATGSAALWAVGYDVVVDRSWRTVTVQASNLTTTGMKALTLVRDVDDRWTVNGEMRPDLDGCVDVPAAFVRADDLRVERLEQRYTLIETALERLLFHYVSSTFDFACELQYDLAGLVVEYPGIATRET